MADIKIDLSSNSYCFAADSHELLLTKKVNFIFGKNGTGKSTLADEIAKQFSDNYNVCIFKDFDGVAENNRLNAVALGAENAKIQIDIDKINEDISEIRKQVEQPEDKAFENLLTNATKTKKSFDTHNTKINNFHASAAQHIKNINNPPVSKTTYHRSDFSGEISKANLLADDDIRKHKNTINSDKKADISRITFPAINLSSYLKSTNEVLGSRVKPLQSIPELKDDPLKQNFAKEGVRIHKHTATEICAFCGNSISDERWAALGDYFNTEVKNLEDRIKDGITKIENELSELDSIKELDADAFYSKYADKVYALNSKIKLTIGEYKKFLDSLKTALEEKNKELFTKTPALCIDLPENFSGIKTDSDRLIGEHNELSKNLRFEQDEARDALRYHEIKKQLNSFNYEEETKKLENLRTLNDKAQADLDNKKAELDTKTRMRTDLILKTKDEEKIATSISKLLKGMGVESFSLKLVDDGFAGQKGQYQIEGHDGKIRPITDLSRGEKNIIAFLYFMLNLESIGNDNRPKIIVLDDPMTSNDDTMQYLMIGEVQKFYENIEQANQWFVLLTHHTHFYLNVRNNKGARYNSYNKHGTFHLYSNGKYTTIKPIASSNDDFKTSYEMLWKELVFLYEQNKPDLMLSSCRKICETYVSFTKKDHVSFYGNNTNAKKLFDVNQHSIDDLEADLNGRTREEIKSILYGLFEHNNAGEHFNSYWRSSNSDMKR